MTKVSFSKILHDDKPLYRKEGYGGKVINDWPFNEFIAIYIEGKQDLAMKLWSEWLFIQFKRYGDMPKRIGGMKDGSIYKESVKLYAYEESTNRNKEDLIKHSINDFVRKKFILIESIISNGYLLNEDSVVIGVRKKEKIILKSGHHRASILFNLGQTSMPNVFLISNLHYQLSRFLPKFFKKFLLFLRK